MRFIYDKEGFPRHAPLHDHQKQLVSQAHDTLVALGVLRPEAVPTEQKFAKDIEYVLTEFTGMALTPDLMAKVIARRVRIMLGYNDPLEEEQDA